MAKAILNITLDPEIKTEFVQFAKELGTTPSSLFSMFAKETLRTRKVSFSSPAWNFEFERFSDAEYTQMEQDTELQGSLDAMRASLSKI